MAQFYKIKIYEVFKNHLYMFYYIQWEEKSLKLQSDFDI